MKRSIRTTPWRRAALKVTLGYGLTAALWILLSDSVAEAVTADPSVLSELQTFKGIAFVSVTAVMLYVLVARQVLAVIRSERALATTEERLRLMVEAVIDYAIFILNPDGSVASWNAGAERIKGYKADEIIGRNVSVFYSVEDAEAGRHELELCDAQAHGRTEHEGWYVRKDGSRFRANVVTTALYDSTGALRGYAKVVRDVTSQCEAQEMIQMAEQKQRLVIENVRDIVYSLRLGADPLRNQLDLVGPQVKNILGCLPDEFCEDRGLWFSLIHPDDVSKVLEALNRLVATKNGETRTYRMRNRRTGEYRWLEDTMVPHLNEQGAAIGIFGVARDITERLKAEGEIHDLERRFEAFMSHNPVMAVIKDESGRYVYVNRRFEEVTGKSLAELKGRLPTEVWPDGLADEIQGGDAAHRLAGAPPTQSFQTVRGPDGEELEFLVSRFEFIESSGRRLLGTLSVDVTEQRKLEAQFRQAQKMEAVGRLAGGIAHDFNNLLGVIVGYGELLQERLAADSAESRHCTQIKSAAQRAAALTRQLLAFSRKQVLEPRVINLNTLVADTSRMLQRLIGEDIELVVSLDPELTMTKADPGQIEQVLMNLVVNARDAMPRGGRLTVETANVLVDQEFVKRHPGSAPGRYVILTVSDTGGGMDTQTQARIFEPFFTTKEAGKGTGLGLSTVYGIVKQSRGYIGVRSEVGIGTTFNVCLPQVDESYAPFTAPLPANTSNAGNGEIVLVAEDADALREMLVEFLTGAGFQVLVASTGAEALSHAEEHSGPIHLVMTDLVMPGVNGVELAARLKASRPDVSVLYMTGYMDDTVTEHGLSGESVNLIQKPFSKRALLEKVSQVLSAAAAKRY